MSEQHQEARSAATRRQESGESSCDQPMRGLYGAETICARPAGHTGKHDPIWNQKDWPQASSAAQPRGQRAFIVPGRDNPHLGTATPFGDTVFSLVAEDGECLAQHVCSNWTFAPGDLYLRRPERAAMFEEKGITEFLWIDEADDITEEELLRRNHALAQTTDPA